jgi:hypothetical protein
MVRFTHHDNDLYSDFRGLRHCVLQRVEKVMKKPCHADPFGAAQGMLREASHRVALQIHGDSGVPLTHHAAPNMQVMLTGGRQFAAWRCGRNETVGFHGVLHTNDPP